MHLATYIGLLETGSGTLAASYRQVAKGHADDADLFHLCRKLADECDEQQQAMAPFRERYGEHRDGEPERLHAQGLSSTRSGGLGLLRDLHDLYLLASYLQMAWTMVGQAGKGARDAELVETVDRCAGQTSLQLSWINTRMKAAAPQALLVAD